MALRTLSTDELNAIAAAHGIVYEPKDSGVAGLLALGMGGNRVESSVSRVFGVPREQIYALLADIGAHSRLFHNIQSSSVAQKNEIGVLAENEDVAFEHVNEAGPMLAVVKYRFNPGESIIKEIITNPFAVEAMDKKKGVVRFDLEDAPEGGTRLKATSIFETPAGPTPFVRGLVDHVWLDFFENVMVEFGELEQANKKAG